MEISNQINNIKENSISIKKVEKIEKIEPVVKDNKEVEKKVDLSFDKEARSYVFKSEVGNNKFQFPSESILNLRKYVLGLPA